MIVAVAVAVAAAGALLTWDAAGHWTAGQWSASAAWVTVFLAYGAAVVAFTQLREARSLRLEQAQPYVAVSMEPLVEVDPKFGQIVLKTFGATAAFNIRVESVPKIERATDSGSEEVPLPMLPTLVPGQEWGTLWDFSRGGRTLDYPMSTRSP